MAPWHQALMAPGSIPQYSLYLPLPPPDPTYIIPPLFHIYLPAQTTPSSMPWAASPISHYPPTTLSCLVYWPPLCPALCIDHPATQPTTLPACHPAYHPTCHPTYLPPYLPPSLCSPGGSIGICYSKGARKKFLKSIAIFEAFTKKNS